MNTNRIVLTFSIIIIVLVISIPTIYKVVNNHYDNLVKVTESKIIEEAKKCYYEEKCSGDIITLKELYDLEYLEEVSNPITKEFYNEDSYVEYKADIFKFIEKE